MIIDSDLVLDLVDVDVCLYISILHRGCCKALGQRKLSALDEIEKPDADGDGDARSDDSGSGTETDNAVGDWH